jgi:D-alanyl-D-alanine carboxypeptidase
MNFPERIAAVLLPAFLTLVGPAIAGTSSLPSPPAVVNGIVEGLLDSVQAEGTPGAVVYVSTPNWAGTWTRGTADLETGRPVAASDTFRIASISKTFTATVILQLADEGFLSLESPLSDFAGGFGVPGAGGITVGQLLDHTSGISDWADSTAAREKLCSVEPDQAPLLDYTPQEMVDMAVSTGPYFPPGEGWAYSNTNYVLLGMIVEWLAHSEVTGTHLGEEIAARILVPLGLENTCYPVDSEMPGLPARAYWVPAVMESICPGWSHFTRAIDGARYNPSQDFGSGAMVSTLEDLATWSRALARGTLISGELHRRQLAWRGHNNFGAYGLGMMYIADGLGHDGVIFVGYNSAMFYLPARDATVIVLLNGSLDGPASSAAVLYFNLVRSLFPSPPLAAGSDYDGSGEPDIAVFRPATGLWAVRGVTRAYFGRNFDIPVGGDYDGNGTVAPGIFRPSTGLWAIRGVTRTYFGTWGDIPVPADYAGNGRAGIGIFRPQNGLWAIKGLTRIYFGLQFDRPLPGDYDGDGTAEPAVFRPSSIIAAGEGMWAVRGFSRFYFGTAGDTPVPGDYSGNGAWSPSIFRPYLGLWAINGLSRFYFGRSGDSPVGGDYAGDGTDAIGIFRQTSGLWAVRGVLRLYFGVSDDIPVTR